MSPQFPTVLLRAQSDERLARLAAQGSERAFEAIVERYRRPLMGYARRIAGDSRAEDVVQAAFVGAWSRLCDGIEVHDLRAWLYRIVHNGALNAVRRASASDVELFDETPALSDLHAEVERRDELRRTLGGIAALPPQQREALVGVAVHGRRHHDVGTELGVTDGAVRMLLHRARTTMRAAATALTPWPLVSWLAGQPGAAAGGTAASGAASGGGAAAGGAGATGAGAGAGLLAGAGLKATAVLSTVAVAAGAGPQVAKVLTSSQGGGPAAQAEATASPGSGPQGSGKAAPAREQRDRGEHARRAPAAQGRPAVPDAGPPVAAPSPMPAPAPGTPPVVVQQDDSTSLPAQPEQDFLDVAEDEEDEIWVQEEPPDPSRGEQPIPPDGVPDAIGEAALPEAPAAAQDERELSAEEAAPPAPPAP